MEHKKYAGALIKARKAEGIVEAIVAVMGNVDLVGDRILSRAFDKSLKKRWPRLLDSHNTDSVLCVLGTCLDAHEVGRADLPVKVRLEHPTATGGLWTRSRYLLETPEGRGAYDRIVAKSVDQYSIGYNVIESDVTSESVGGQTQTVRNLVELELHEFSPVIFAANPATRTVSTKGLYRRVGLNVSEQDILRVRWLHENKRLNWRRMSRRERLAMAAHIEQEMAKMRKLRGQ